MKKTLKRPIESRDDGAHLVQQARIVVDIGEHFAGQVGEQPYPVCFAVVAEGPHPVSPIAGLTQTGYRQRGVARLDMTQRRILHFEKRIGLRLVGDLEQQFLVARAHEEVSITFATEGPGVCLDTKLGFSQTLRQPDIEDGWWHDKTSQQLIRRIALHSSPAYSALCESKYEMDICNLHTSKLQGPGRGQTMTRQVNRGPSSNQ